MCTVIALVLKVTGNRQNNAIHPSLYCHFNVSCQLANLVRKLKLQDYQWRKDHQISDTCIASATLTQVL